MKTNPFQIARWSLFSSFALMVLIVCLPNPEPSTAWQLAQQERYEQRFPQLRRPAPPAKEPPIQFAEESLPPTPPKGLLAEKTPSELFRTAQLPDISEKGDGRDGVRIQRPIFFEDDAPANPLTPDPVHLDPPADSAHMRN